MPHHLFSEELSRKGSPIVWRNLSDCAMMTGREYCGDYSDHRVRRSMVRTAWTVSHASAWKKARRIRQHGEEATLLRVSTDRLVDFQQAAPQRVSVAAEETDHDHDAYRSMHMLYWVLQRSVGDRSPPQRVSAALRTP